MVRGTANLVWRARCWVIIAKVWMHGGVGFRWGLGNESDVLFAYFVIRSRSCVNYCEYTGNRQLKCI